MRRSILFSAVGITVVVSSMLLAAGTASAVATDLDPTFGGSGTGYWTGYPAGGGGAGATLQADGKILVAGTLRDADANVFNFQLVRLTSAGVPDPTFSGDGIRTMFFGPTAHYAEGGTALVRPDGRIIEVGTAQGTAGSFVALVRFLPDGHLDTSFGEAGKVLVPAPRGRDVIGMVGDAALRSDGRILALVRVRDNAGAEAFMTVGLTPSGHLDPTWGDRGRVISHPDESGDVAFPTSIAVQPGGKVVVAGNTGGPPRSTGVVLRYRPDGRIDRSFSTDGRRTVGMLNVLSDVVPLAGGSVVLSGLAGRDHRTVPDPGGGTMVIHGFDQGRVVRLLSTGTIARAFGRAGAASVTPGPLLFEGGQVARQPGGSWVFATEAFDRTELCDFSEVVTAPMLARFGPSGRRDPTFSGDGVAVGPSDLPTFVSDVVIQSDGKPVVSTSVSCNWHNPLSRVMRFPAG